MINLNGIEKLNDLNHEVKIDIKTLKKLSKLNNKDNKDFTEAEILNEIAKLVQKKYTEVDKLARKYFYYPENISPVNMLSTTKEIKNFEKFLKDVLKINYPLDKIAEQQGPFQTGIDIKIMNKKTKKITKTAFTVIVIPEIKFWNQLKYNINFVNSLFDNKISKKIAWLLFMYHELTEAQEYFKKEANQLNNNNETGSIWLNYYENLYQIGNHHTLMVLAEEAVILNNFYKQSKVLEKMRNVRELEWKIIKQSTGIDLSKLTSFDDIKKLKIAKIKNQKKIITSNLNDNEELVLDELEGIFGDYTKLSKPSKVSKILKILNKIF